jgi:hypothetical protein
MHDRKYTSEFAINMQAIQLLVMQQQTLGDLSDEQFTPPYQCHIYGIARRPRLSLDPTAIEITPDRIRATVNAHRQDQKEPYQIEMRNFPNDPIVSCECPYPYTRFIFRNGKGEIELEGSVAQFLTKAKTSNHYPELVDLEILYIGQAYGKDGSRTSPQRLAKHETLQKIYSEAIANFPDMEIWIVLFIFTEMLIASIDGRDVGADMSPGEDTAHIDRVFQTSISESHRINYCEAALIRYFQPEYNDRFKDSFPTPAHGSYAECYKLNLHSVAVEVDSRNLGLRFWSKSVAPDWVHMPFFSLRSEQERKGFWGFIPTLSKEAPKTADHPSS